MSWSTTRAPPDSPRARCVRVDVGAGRHRTLLASASGDGAMPLRVLEAGDRVTVAAASGRCTAAATTTAPAGRTRSAVSTRPTCCGSRPRAASCARAERAPRPLVARHRNPGPRAARPHRRVPPRRHARHSTRRHCGVPELRAVAPPRGVGRERRVRARARERRPAPVAARRAHRRRALDHRVVRGDDAIRAVGAARVGDGRDRAPRVVRRASHLVVTGARLRGDRPARYRPVLVAFGRVLVVVRRERRDRGAARRSRAACPAPNSCASHSRSRSRRRSASCRSSSGRSARSRS